MKNLLYIGNKLAKHGYNKTTIETLGPALELEGYEVIYCSDKKVFLLRLLDMIATTIKSARKVDYILIDTYSTKAFWYALVCSQLARYLNIKYIPILHGGNLPLRLKNNPHLSRLIFQNAYKNIAPSGYLQHEFEQAGYADVNLIPNAIPIKDYRFQLRVTLAPKLLWVRAFATIYNPKMAVDVLELLQIKYPNASLTMVGPDKDGSLWTTQNYAQEKGVSVNFTGQLTKEEWWELASEHAIFINTTNFDNTPVSVMEAMALGLPVVSTIVGGIPFLLKDLENALLVGANQAEAMSESIINLIEHPSQAAVMAQNARTTIEQIDWELIKQKWFHTLS